MLTFVHQKKMMEIYEYIFKEFKEGRIAPFYEKMYPELLAYTTRLLGEDFAFLSEDCVQDVVFQTYQRKDTFTSLLQWKIFLYTCVRNKAISVLRKGQAQRNYLSQVEEGEDDLSVSFIEQETITLVYEAINALPQKYKTIFEMSFEQGLKNAEIAQALQVAEITVKKQKSKMIEMIRLDLQRKMDKELLCVLLGVFENSL